MYDYRLIIYFQVIPGEAKSTWDVKITARKKANLNKTPTVGSAALIRFRLPDASYPSVASAFLRCTTFFLVVTFVDFLYIKPVAPVAQRYLVTLSHVGT